MTLRGAQLRRGRLLAAAAARDAGGAGCDVPARRRLHHGQPGDQNERRRAHLLDVVATADRHSLSRPGCAGAPDGREGAGRPRLPVPFESARALLGAVGIETRMPWSEAARRLRLAATASFAWTLERIAAVTREHGAVPVFLALDNVADPPAEGSAPCRTQRRPGFWFSISSTCGKDRDKPALRIAEWDNHPNAAGHRLIADRLFELMQQHRSRAADRNALGKGSSLAARRATRHHCVSR